MRLRTIPSLCRDLTTARMNELEIEQTTADKWPSAPAWRGAGSIHLVRQLNAQCIDMICELALDRSDECPWPFVTSNRDLWCRLDAEARDRLSFFPFSIVDVRFHDEMWWCAPDRWRTVGGRRLEVSTMPASRIECLALETLMFAWQVARSDRLVAEILFAMPRPAARCIAALTMQQIRTAAIDGARFLRVRWDTDSRFWRGLLIAAWEADRVSLERCKRHSLMLFGRELTRDLKP